MRSIKVLKAIYVMVALTSALCLTAQVPATSQKKNLAILLFNGVELIDYAGPFEALSYARKDGGFFFNIYFVAATKDAVQNDVGLKVLPDYDFASAPKPDYVLVPGGNVWATLKDSAVIEWLKETASKAKVSMSVCTGAYILAKAGLLDNKPATVTAYHAYTNYLAGYGKNIDVRYDRRYVWGSDRILTTAGLSSGIDGALALIEKEIGLGAAQDAALSMEYNWHPENGFVIRSNLAEMTFLNTASMLKSPLFKGNVILSTGDEIRWQKVFTVIEQRGIDSLSKNIAASLTTEDNWAGQMHSTSTGFTNQFEDKRKRPFSGEVVIKPKGNDIFEVIITVKKIE